MPPRDLPWLPVAPDLPIATCEYMVGPGRSKALAVPCAGGLAIVSPPYDAAESTYAAIEARGRVRALVAPNGLHYMGMAAWKARFPDAAIFAPADAVVRVAKKTRLSDVKPLSELGALAEPGVELIELPRVRGGETLVRVKNGAHVAWYLTHLITNMPTLPPEFPFKHLFAWTKSGPGLRPNGVFSMFLVKDKRALHGMLRAELDRLPPTIFVPCHGHDVVEGVAEKLRELLG